MLRMLVVVRDAPNAAGDTAEGVLAEMANVLDSLVADPRGREQFADLTWAPVASTCDLDAASSRRDRWCSGPRCPSIRPSCTTRSGQPVGMDSAQRSGGHHDHLEL
jgi:hypothetical protein